MSKGKGEGMCPHDDFDILYYKDGVMIRRCKDCRQIEVYLEFWADAQNLHKNLGRIIAIEE